MKKIFFKKYENTKHASKRREKSAHHGLSLVVWQSVERNFSSTERHSTPLMLICIVLRFQELFRSIFYLVKHSKRIFWLNWGIQTCLIYLSSKIITCIIIFKNWSNQDFFQTHEHMSQTRGISPWPIHFQKNTTIIIFSKKKIKLSRF